MFRKYEVTAVQRPQQHEENEASCQQPKARAKQELKALAHPLTVHQPLLMVMCLSLLFYEDGATDFALFSLIELLTMLRASVGSAGRLSERIILCGDFSSASACTNIDRFHDSSP